MFLMVLPVLHKILPVLSIFLCSVFTILCILFSLIFLISFSHDLELREMALAVITVYFIPGTEFVKRTT